MSASSRAQLARAYYARYKYTKNGHRSNNGATVPFGTAGMGNTKRYGFCGFIGTPQWCWSRVAPAKSQLALGFEKLFRSCKK